MQLDDIETIVANSYRDFHAKGFDYLCLKRTPQHTLKVYFFDEYDAAGHPEVVIPHNHRYDFGTTVLAGSMRNHVFLPYDGNHRAGEVYDCYAKFDYRTPLNGGDGFVESGASMLARYPGYVKKAGQDYHSLAETVHTIEILTDRTVLLLEQYHDKLPLDVPTQAWSKVPCQRPSIDGLYSRMTKDYAWRRLNQAKELLVRHALRRM